MNTRFSYMYRDSANWKTFYDFVVAGEFSPAQKEAVQNACDGTYFIPSVLGLPGGVLETDPGYDERYDHPWCEFDADCDLELTEDPPTVSYTADSLTEAFIACQDMWEVLPVKESAEISNVNHAQQQEDGYPMPNLNPMIDADDTIVGHINKNGTRETQWFRGTPEHIASFLMRNQDADQITLTDKFDNLILSAFGCFIDSCPDKALLGTVLEHLVPMQMGEATPQAFETLSQADLEKGNLPMEDPAYAQATQLLASICENQFPELYAAVFRQSDQDLIFKTHDGSYQLVYYNPDANADGQIVQCPFTASQAQFMVNNAAYMGVLAQNTQYLSDINTDHFFHTMLDLLSAKEAGRFLGTDINAVCRAICKELQEMQQGKASFDETLSAAASRAGEREGADKPTHTREKSKDGDAYEK